MQAPMIGPDAIQTECGTAGYGPNARELDHESLIQLLPMYAPTWVTMKHAVFHEEELVATFRTFRHPFTLEDAKHLTREHVLLYITQAAYVFVSSLCDFRPNWPFDAEQFRRIGLTEQATFSKIEMNFRRLIPNVDGAHLRMHCVRERVMGKRVFMRLAFDFLEGCNGICEGFIAADASLRPGLAWS